MIKKVFILTQFGEPHEWTQQYLDNVKRLGQFGWYWKIFTPNKYENVPSNVEIVPMTIEEFNSLIEKKCGVNPLNFITGKGVPSKPVSDFYVASGLIFEDYIKSFDFWGITNWDIVYGRLDHFLYDDFFETVDIFTDDVDQINGIFSLYRNRFDINNLFKQIPEWEKMFTEHRLFGTDEVYFIEPVRKASREQLINYKYSADYPMHSYDRLIQHVPIPQLEVQADGSLWEKFKDVAKPAGKGGGGNGKDYIAREIPYFHFSYTKKWPLK